MKLNTPGDLLIKLRDGQHVCSVKNEENIKFLEDLELVEVYHNRFIITHKGNLAASMGLNAYIECYNTEKEILNFSTSRNRNRRQFLLITFTLLFILFIAALILNQFLLDFI